MVDASPFASSSSSWPVGERHFRRAIQTYAAHYHVERNHQGLRNELIDAVRPSGKSERFVGVNVSGDFSVITTVRRSAKGRTNEHVGGIVGH